MDVEERVRREYLAGRMHQAAALARSVLASQPDRAEVWRLLGRVARHLGDAAASDAAFERAAVLLPRQMPAPHRVTRERFEALVEEARVALRDPEAAVRRGMRRQGRDDSTAAERLVAVRELPTSGEIEAGVSPDCRWRRQGDRLVVYQWNVEHMAGSDQQIVRQLMRGFVSR